MSEYAIKGIYRDQLLNAEGCVVFDSGWNSNLIVANCRVLLAAFMRNDARSHGIQSLQVGRGNAAWDTTPPPPPDPNTTTKLEDPSPFIIPVADLGIQYLNDRDEAVAGPTSRIQITATLGPGKPAAESFPLREFGLFGALDNAPGSPLPFMIDYIRHPLIEKSGSVTLERRVRLIF
jgi:hypothetical protein